MIGRKTRRRDMRVLRTENYNTKKTFRGRLNSETISEIADTIKNNSELNKFMKQAMQLPGDENTLISVYQNSKKRFTITADTSKEYVQSFFGTFMSITNKLSSKNKLIEKRISPHALEIDADILKLITKENVASLEKELFQEEINAGKFKTADEFFKSKKPKTPQEKPSILEKASKLLQDTGWFSSIINFLY